MAQYQFSFDPSELDVQLKQLSFEQLQCLRNMLLNDPKPFPLKVFVRENMPASNTGQANEIIIGLRLDSSFGDKPFAA